MTGPAPLDGLNVVDLTTLLPGPLAGLMLAEAGADVVKIERPGGEEMRSYPPQKDGKPLLYSVLNAGKTVRHLDLKTSAGRDAALALIEKADILIEQFRPGVMDRLGLGATTLRAANPGLIYCAISGYGQSGPLSTRAGHDLNYIGETGLLDLAPGAPNVPPALIADIGGGTFPAVINILLALIKRQRTGKGSVIDVAMTDAMFTFAWWAYAGGAATGAWPASNTGRLAGGSPRYGLYRAADGMLIAVAALEDKFWSVLCDATALPAQFRDDGADPAATRRELADIIAGRPGIEWEPVFEQADCCVSVVRTLADAVRHPHFVGRGLFDQEIAFADGTTLPALPVPIAGDLRSRRQRKAPESG